MTDNPYESPTAPPIRKPRRPLITPAQWAMTVMAILIAMTWLYMLGLL